MSQTVPPPPERTSPEATGGSQPTAPPSARKKPWSKPGVRLIEDGALVTESSPDPDFTEDHLYYIGSF